MRSYLKIIDEMYSNIKSVNASHKSVFWKRSFAISVTVLVKPKKIV